VVREVLADHGLTGWPKTSGSRGIHVYARVERHSGFGEVRRAEAQRDGGRHARSMPSHVPTGGSSSPRFGRARTSR